MEGNVGTEGPAGSKPGWRDAEDKARRQPRGLLDGPSQLPRQERTKGVWAGVPPSKVVLAAGAAPPPHQEHSKSLGMARGAGGRCPKGSPEKWTWSAPLLHQS